MNAIFNFFAFGLGACVGSFLNVCVARWPANMSVVSPPSRCPGCERPIRAYENVPIVGWIALRGRCAGCGIRISPQYPLVELLVALVWLAAVAIFGPTLAALRLAVFVTVMLGISLTDAKHYVIPDGFTVFGLLWVVATAIAGLFVRETTPFAAPAAAIFGACAGAGAIAIAGWAGEIALGREAMGFGDTTLMAVAGAALGPERALLTIFIGALLGSIVFLVIVLPLGRARARAAGTEHEPPMVPFGVFLAPAAIIVLFAGDPLISWYTTRFLGG